VFNIVIFLAQDFYQQILLTLGSELVKNIAKIFENFTTQIGLNASIVSLRNVTTIHRFFDSSPFSPSNGLIALTELPYLFHGSLANIVVIDLKTSERTLLDTVSAWGSQLGANLQWGYDDRFLFYNTFEKSNNNNLINLSIIETFPYQDVQSVKYNLIDKSKTIFDCPVYHISGDGKFSISPNLSKIKFTQRGYGVEVDTTMPNKNAPTDDGVFLMDLLTGDCKLVVSLRRLVSTIGFYFC
jgi:hypothetical protein